MERERPLRRVVIVVPDAILDWARLDCGHVTVALGAKPGDTRACPECGREGRKNGS